MVKVLITRPILDALETSKILQNFCIESLCSPLIEIKKTPHEHILFSDYDILIFTSKNAVRNFKFSFQKNNTNGLIFSIGNKTKNLLTDYGFKNVTSTNGNLESFKIPRLLRPGGV